MTAAGRVARTSARGVFYLEGLPEALGPVTAGAEGFATWTLEAEGLERFDARLRPLTPRTRPQAEVIVRLSAPTPISQTRVAWLALDTDQIVELTLQPGQTIALIRFDAPVGTRTITALAPPRGQEVPPWWAPPRTFDLTSQGAEVPLELTVAAPSAVTVTVDPTPGASQIEVSLVCADDAGLSLLAGRARAQAPVPLEILAPPGITSCELLARFERGTPEGPAVHLAFAQHLTPDALRGTIALQAPPAVALRVEVDPDTGALSWPEVPGATLYDVFLAPWRTALEEPTWSLSTGRARISPPSLPPDARAALLDNPSAGGYAVRVVARMAPGLELAGDWDWSGYYGHISSPWQDISQETARHWGLISDASPEQGSSQDEER